MCLAGILAGCQTQRPSTFTSQQRIAKRPSVTAATYLQQAKRAEGDKKFSLLLLASDAALANGNLRQAKKLLRRLADQELSEQQVLRLRLLQAEYQLASNHPARAKSILLRSRDADLFGLGQQRQRLLVQAYQRLGQRLMAIKTEVYVLRQVRDPAERNREMIGLWEQLSSQPLSQLQHWVVQVPADSPIAGWLRLAMIMREDEIASPEWYRDLNQWREGFPNHLATALIPSGPAKSTARQPERIALLLPLTGPHAVQGEAVRRGFYAAYFQQRDKQGAQAPVLQVYDTNEAPIATLLQRVQEQRMTEIVGPLLKPNLQTLLQQPPKGIPVLALNSVAKNAAGVVQFSLAPESSVDQLAAGMAAAKRWRVAVLAPNNALGERLLQRFRGDWSQYHGDVVGVFRYEKTAGYAAGVQRLLNIDQANARKKRLQRVLGKKLRFLADRRQDIDAILLIGDRSAAQSLKPLLSFYFAGNLPVYTTSQLVDSPGKHRRLADLNGLQFLATPWQAIPLAKIPLPIGQIRAQLQQTWPRSTRKNAQFYAMGVDAYFVLQRLPMLQSMPNFSYFGETGLLSMDVNHRIYPRLLWAKLAGGKTQLLDRG